MAEKSKSKSLDEGGAGSAVQAKPRPKRSPRRTPPRMLPPWKVLLHNDDKNDHLYVVETIMALTPLDEDASRQRMMEADRTGVSLLLVTHKERAELYKDQFESKGLTVTIEPEGKE